MAILQGLTVIIAALVALIGFLQWLTARQKAVFDLFDKRFKIYEVVKNCVVQVGKLRQDIVVVHTFKTLGPARMKDDAANRSEAMGRIHKFYETGRPLFAKYMRFSQPVALISQIATRFRSSD